MGHRRAEDESGMNSGRGEDDQRAALLMRLAQDAPEDARPISETLAELSELQKKIIAVSESMKVHQPISVGLLIP